MKILLFFLGFDVAYLYTLPIGTYSLAREYWVQQQILN